MYRINYLGILFVLLFVIQNCRYPEIKVEEEELKGLTVMGKWICPKKLPLVKKKERPN